jgi:hypothetical protein
MSTKILTPKPLLCKGFVILAYIEPLQHQLTK